jgi:hypothetical protein
MFLSNSNVIKINDVNMQTVHRFEEYKTVQSVNREAMMLRKSLYMVVISPCEHADSTLFTSSLI